MPPLDEEEEEFALGHPWFKHGARCRSDRIGGVRGFIHTRLFAALQVRRSAATSLADSKCELFPKEGEGGTIGGAPE